MGNINRIVVHCSASNFGTVATIRKWHLARGWSDIGYHFVISNGYPVKGFLLESMRGQIDYGRSFNADHKLTGAEIGAHAYGFNGESIGICLIGDDVFAMEQFESLIDLVRELMRLFDIPLENVVGHNELPGVTKTCPNFPMKWIRNYINLGEKYALRTP